MKRLKTYEGLYEEGKNGNYLTKKYQRKDEFNPYLYDDHFGDKYYICHGCDSYKLTPTSSSDGFSPPDWHCDNCGAEVYEPMSLSPKQYEVWLSVISNFSREEREAKKRAKKYNL